MNLFKFIYSVDGVRYEGASRHCEVRLEQEGKVVRAIVSPNRPIKVIECRMDLDVIKGREEAFLANGWQSWSYTKELIGKEKTPMKGPLYWLAKKPFKLVPYGDYAFVEKHPQYAWTYTYLRKGDHYKLVGSISEKEGFTEIYVDRGSLHAVKENVGQILSEETPVFQLYVDEGSESDVFDGYASAWGRKPTSQGKVVGYCSWYRHYEKLSEEVLLKDLCAAKEKNMPFSVFQMDDGYESKIGDWLLPKKDEFPHGIEVIAKESKNAGLIPGIWLAPFCVSPQSVLYKEHPDYVQKDAKGNPVYMGGNWGGCYALDFHQGGVKQYLRDVFGKLQAMGYEVYKLDFLYAACLTIQENETRGGLMQEAMEFLREVLKGSKILGCGVPLGSAFFTVDYCRVGPDVSLNYKGDWYMRVIHREGVSTERTLSNTEYRRQLDQRFFLCDPDVILFHGNSYTEEEKRRVFDIDTNYGSVYLTSDDFTLYSKEEVEAWESLAKKER